ncbi:MAG: hypothetical protein ACI4HI_02930 [Lachnospiraceae bacterium]
MLFQKKIERLLSKKEPEETPEPLEKGDRLALFLSACIVFVPAILLTLGGLALISYLFFC